MLVWQEPSLLQNKTKTLWLYYVFSTVALIVIDDRVVCVVCLTVYHYEAESELEVLKKKLMLIV